MGLDGRTALVTGSGRNVGEAIAKALARRGANIVVNVRASVSDGERVAEEIRALGVESILAVADVSDSFQVRDLARRALERFGTVDVLVNNVGIAPAMALQETTDEFWDLVVRTSLSSAFFCIRELVGSMVERRWGRIIQVGGHAGLKGTKYKAANAAAKNGIIGLTRAVANEFAEYGITCNHVGPGYLERGHEVVYYQDRIRELDPKYKTKEWRLQSIPAGRLGTPDDIATVCDFLASDEASYITGQTILVNGGMTFV